MPFPESCSLVTAAVAGSARVVSIRSTYTCSNKSHSVEQQMQNQQKQLKEEYSRSRVERDEEQEIICDNRGRVQHEVEI